MDVGFRSSRPGRAEDGIEQTEPMKSMIDVSLPAGVIESFLLFSDRHQAQLGLGYGAVKVVGWFIVALVAFFMAHVSSLLMRVTRDDRLLFPDERKRGKSAGRRPVKPLPNQAWRGRSVQPSRDHGVIDLMVLISC